MALKLQMHFIALWGVRYMRDFPKTILGGKREDNNVTAHPDARSPVSTGDFIFALRSVP